MKMLALLKQQQEAGAYCDATLRVGHEKVVAHRCVLAASSKYFDRMFLGNFKEKDSTEIDLTENISSFELLKLVVSSIYSENITVSEDNVQELLHISTLFLIQKIEEHCLTFLLDQLSLQNSIWTWAVADRYSLQEAEEICSHTVTSRFNDTLIHSHEMLTVPSEHLLWMLQRGIAKHCGKDQLGTFLSRWAEVDDTHDIQKAYKAAGHQNPLDSQLDPSEPLSMNIHVPMVPVSNFAEDNVMEVSKDLDHDKGTKDKETDSKAKNTENHSDLLDEEVFIHTGPFKTCGCFLLYRPRTKRWLKLRKASKYIGRSDILYAVGLGPLYDIVILRNKLFQRYTVVNTTTEESYSLPAPDSEMQSPTESVTPCGLFCSLNKVFSLGVVKTKRIRGKKRLASKEASWNDNLKGLFKEREIIYNKLVIEDFNFETKKWARVKTVHEMDFRYKAVDSVIRENGKCYICAVTERDKIHLFLFQPAAGSLCELGRLSKQIPSEQLFLLTERNVIALDGYGLEKGIIIRTKENDLYYDIGKNCWEVRNKLPVKPYSDFEGIINLTKNHGVLFASIAALTDIYPSMNIYDPQSEEIVELPAMPVQGNFTEDEVRSAEFCKRMVVVRVVNSRFLDRLQEITGLKQEKGEKVSMQLSNDQLLCQERKSSILKKYQARISPETCSQEDSPPTNKPSTRFEPIPFPVFPELLDQELMDRVIPLLPP